jgi:hypothetical protein
MPKQTCQCTHDGYQACVKAIMNYDYNANLDKIKREQVMVLIR